MTSSGTLTLEQISTTFSDITEELESKLKLVDQGRLLITPDVTKDFYDGSERLLDLVNNHSIYTSHPSPIGEAEILKIEALVNLICQYVNCSNIANPDIKKYADQINGNLVSARRFIETNIIE